MYIKNAFAIAPVLENNVFLDLPDDAPVIQLVAREPRYIDYIPRGLLRRMGKATRMGVGAALQLMDQQKDFDGIVIGTGLGGMEDCIKFLNQIVDYDEGTLTPTNFVQSTPNALAGTLGLMTKNTGYNMTHVGRGGAFEGALMDAMLTMEVEEEQSLLLGSTEEISDYNFNIDQLENIFVDHPIPPSDLYTGNHSGTFCGEGAVMLNTTRQSDGTHIKVERVFQLSSTDQDEINEWFSYVNEQLETKKISDVILGKSGDQRTDFHYDNWSRNFSANELAFKHTVGEYPSSTAFALYLAYRLVADQQLPDYFYTQKTQKSPSGNIVIYNHYKGEEHSIILVSPV